MKHKPIPQSLRQQVFAKYNGHCAYCGELLTYKEMQVDHLVPLWHNHLDGKEQIQDDSLENLMPSCRKCNYYKGGGSLDSFRNYLMGINRIIIATNEMASKYGMITVNKWDGKFYFEKMKGEQK